ncbi:RHS repeat-associated core domain-containing protein [Leptospira kmetyi]|uniref:Teneurin-like YD-shell domain-containing protein n=1 Tax=Leptospira kmetyi TaxID=408139 RepID=A0ABX4NDE2_9LEPT|nr:RHS repeat-associated core domain-containing protein [Leptospira kmetyi]PJZ29480.1 hypothetical protein CH378_12370 [Leptospira kmetyi]
MKSRTFHTFILVFALLFVFNFSFISSIKSAFSFIASAVAGGIPQELPIIRANPDGSASTSITIELPPGTRGVIPELSLAYSSNGGNGIAGMGWNLTGMPTIFRNPSFDIQYNGSDQFVSSLAGELVDVSGNRSEFHSKKETWVQFVPQGSCGDGPCTWIATDRSGRRFIFGGTADSRITAIGRGSSLREWALSREEDSFGNGYNVTYTPFDSTNGDYYPQRITYNDRSIDFTFENRSDKSPIYSFGTLYKMQQRLESIEVNVAGHSIRKYELDYEYGPVTGRSILKTFQRSGSNAFGAENFEDIVFNYSNHSGEFIVQSVDYMNRSEDYGMEVYIPDAIMDIVNVYFNSTLPYHPTKKDTNVDIKMQYVVKMPVPDRNACNGGIASCLCAILPQCTGGNAHFWEFVAGNCASFNGWGGVNGCLNGIDTALVTWIPLDINGDGTSDFVALNGDERTNSIHLSGNILKVGSPASSNINSVSLPIHYNTFYQAVDLNGDGKTDFAYEDGGKLWVVYSLGSSFSSPVQFGNVNMDGANRNMTSFSPYEYQFQYSPKNTIPVTNDRALKDYFADMNGDGLSDFIHFSGGSYFIYINRETYFDNPITIAGSADFFINAMIDFTGDGLADHVQLVQSYDNSTLVGLKGQRDALDSQMNQIQQDHQRAQDVVDLIAVGNAASINPTEFQYLTNYIGVFGGLGAIPTVLALQNSSGGTTLSATDAVNLTNDLNNIVAGRISPLAQQSQTISGQIGAILASGTGGAATYTIQVRSFNINTGNSIVRSYSIGGSIDPYRSTLTDANGDGKMDFVTFSGSQAVVSLFTGSGFTSPIYSPLNSGDSTKLIQFNFGDVNGDSLADLVLMNKTSNRYETYLSNGDGKFNLNDTFSFGSFSFQEYTDEHGIERSDSYQIFLQDLNNDGISDLSVASVNVLKTNGQVSFRFNNAHNSGEDLLEVVSNNAGQRSLVQYTRAHNHSGAISAGSGNYPNIPNTSPNFLAIQTIQELGAGIVKRANYQFTNLRYLLGTKAVARSLGFASVRLTDPDTGFYSISDYFQNDYRLSGVVQSERNYNSSNNLIHSMTTSGFSFPNPYGTEIFLPGNITTSQYQNGVFVSSSLKSITYDGYGFPTNETEDLGSHTITRTTQYSHDVASWRIGRVIRARKNVDGAWVEDVQNGYSGDKVISRTEFPFSSSPLTTSFGYDSYGNVISIQDPGTGMNLIAYDTSLNYFPISKTNALGHVSTSTYDLALGLELTITDPNGAVTTKNFDSYGRIIDITYPGESSPNETYVYDNTGSYDLVALSNNESITKNIRDSVSGNVTVSKIYKDPFGNTIRTEENTSISGVSTIEEVVFDYSIGKMIKKSNLYLSNQLPQYTLFQYNDPDKNLSSIVMPHSSGTILTNITRSGLTETKSTNYPDSQTLSTSETINELGQVISRTEQGRTIAYSYSPFGEMATITDPSGLITSFAYDSLGRRISTQDPNSGSISLSYDSSGRIQRQTDARSKTVSFTYDAIGRVLTQSTNGSESPIQFGYDDSSVPFSKGKVTQVTDGSGSVSFLYNQRGQAIQKKKVVDDIVAIFKTDYDSLGRATILTYPDGTKVHQNYATHGAINSITMDSADGTSVGHTVVSYEGPYLNADGLPTLKRVSGNGVSMEVVYEPIDQKPKETLTKKPDGSLIGNKVYTYDSKGNFTKIEDRLNPGRTQTYTLDSINRVTQAVGKYGTQNYSYSANGNLLHKGAYTLSYADSNHANAVTTVTSASTGPMQYAYDASGNMISRNGDTFRYDSFGKLIEITPNGTSQSILYSYDYTGSRIKVVSTDSLTTIYSFGDIYEIMRVSGQPEKHTLYIRGIQGEIVAQWTRDNATLQLANQLEESNGDRSAAFGLIGRVSDTFCKDVTIECKTYYKNRFQERFRFVFGYSAFFQEGIPTQLYNAFYFLILLGFLYLAYPYFLKGNELLQRLSWQGVGTPALILSIFVLTSLPGCGVLPGSGGHGDPPWILAMGGNLSPEVVSIQNPGGNSGGGMVGGAPVNGMYFYHPDHLGSTTMITDGYGNPASGPEPGVSNVSYDPYGSIDRNDSYGPDIFRYKFTGQIEDKESQLYYYKSRYYDPVLGRFVQADSEIHPNSVNGQNRYMYVEGNPVNFKDTTGNSLDMMFYAALYQYSQSPNNANKANNGLMLIYLHNQQIRNTSGPGCPISSKNRQVFGNFQGNGRCGGSLPKDVGSSMANILFAFSVFGIEGGAALALAFYFLNKPNSALTIVDRSGIAHDEEHSWDLNNRTAHANEEWIKQSWGNYFSVNEQRAAYKREYNALPKQYDRYGGSGKTIIAGVNFVATALFDLTALYVGTTIFAYQNVYSYYYLGVSNAAFVPKARYNNFWKPKKWKW